MRPYCFMNKSQLESELESIVDIYRRKPYDFFRQWLEREQPVSPIIEETMAENGTDCVTEIQAYWDDNSQQEIRVLFGIDDGGWRFIAPVCYDFIIQPDGTILG